MSNNSTIQKLSMAITLYLLLGPRHDAAHDRSRSGRRRVRLAAPQARREETDRGTVLDMNACLRHERLSRPSSACSVAVPL